MVAAAGELFYTTYLLKLLCVAHNIIFSTSAWLKTLRTDIADTYRQLELTACSVSHVGIRPYYHGEVMCQSRVRRHIHG